jgi:hypothetical protein
MITIAVKIKICSCILKGNIVCSPLIHPFGGAIPLQTFSKIIIRLWEI